MQLIRFVLATLLAVMAGAIPMGKPLPSPTPTDCPTDGGDITFVSTTTVTISRTINSKCPATTTTLPAKRALANTTPSMTKGMPKTTDRCPAPEPTSSVTVIETETTTATICYPATPTIPAGSATNTGNLPCQTDPTWTVPYSSFGPHDDKYGPNWWRFDVEQGLQNTTIPAAWEWNWNPPTEVYMWQVGPNPSLNGTGMSDTARAYEDICITPGRNYQISVLAGGIKDKLPINAYLTVRIGTKYLLQEQPICTPQSPCTDDSWNFRTSTDEHITIGTYSQTGVTMDGTLPNNWSDGVYQKLEVMVTYDSADAAAGANGVFVTNIWVRPA